MKFHHVMAGATGAHRGRALRTLGAVATSVVIAVGVSACAGSGGSGSTVNSGRTASTPAAGVSQRAGAAAQSPSVPASAAPTAASAAPAAAPGDFPCNVFTFAQIKAATGYDIVKAEPVTAVADRTQKSCEWMDAQGHVFGVTAATHDGRHALQVFTLIRNTGAAISGIGDAAWGNESGIGVVFGDAYVQVADDSDSDNMTLAKIGIDQLKQMATAVHDKMG